MGQQWTPLNVNAHYPWPYCRAAFFLTVMQDRVFIGAGNGPPAIKVVFSQHVTLANRGAERTSAELPTARFGALPTIRMLTIFLSL